MAFLVASAARCSSTSGGNVVPEGDDASDNTSSSGTSSSGTGSSGTSSSGTGSSGTGSSGGNGSASGIGGGGGTDAGDIVEASADGGCPSMASVTEGTKITFQVGWPSSTAGDPGTGSISIWLLTTFNVSGTTLTGTSRSCGLVLPDLIFNGTGMIATGGGTKLNIQILNTTWDAITRTFPTTGTQSGWNTGDTQDTNPALGLIGLSNSSAYNSDTKPWPASCATGCTPAGSFMSSDLQDDDGDGLPGITAHPSTATGYALPPTSDLFAEVADQVYIVSRNEIAISGMDTDCVTGKGTGTATITLFDNHVVGCHVTNPSGQNFGTPGPCTSSQVSFLDDNRTIYGYDQTMGDTISKSHPVTGTATVARLASTATCADARGALP